MPDLKLVIRGVDELSAPLAKIFNIADELNDKIGLLLNKFAKLKIQTTKAAEFSKLKSFPESNSVA